MRIRVISIGKTNMKFVKDGIDEYSKRINRYTKFSLEELPDVKNGGKLDQNTLKEKEGVQILSAIRQHDTLILLDENGTQFSSIEFSSWLDKQFMHASGDLCFVIGGAYGFSRGVYERASFSISLSKMTFSHQIIRSIFSEQLYRAFTILRGEPYHHA